MKNQAKYTKPTNEVQTVRLTQPEKGSSEENLLRRSNLKSEESFFAIDVTTKLVSNQIYNSAKQVRIIKNPLLL